MTTAIPARVLLLVLLVLGGCPIQDDAANDTDRAADDDTDAVVDTDVTDTDVPAPPPYRPFPQHVSYPGASIHPSTPQATMDDDVRAAYARWKSAYLEEASPRPDGTRRMRVRMDDDPSAPTVSEGQGYGVVIITLMAGEDPQAQAEVEALWAYFDDHRSGIDRRLMDWKVPANEHANPDEDDSAFDGDADLAYGLLLASAQWGATGTIDYQAKALEILRGMLASEVGPDSRFPLLGDWIDPSGEDFDQWTTRSSDWMPAHFRAFARASGEPAWDDVADTTLDLARAMQSDFAPTTGLVPDFIVGTHGDPRPADPDFLEDLTDGMYGYNAGRVPWRIGFDALTAGDARSLAATRALTSWFDDTTLGDPFDIAPGYQLDGFPVLPRDDWTSFFTAPLGVAAMTDTTQQRWLDDLYDSVVDTQEGYYEDSITLQCLLVMSGNAWTP